METYSRNPNCKCSSCSKPIYRRPSQLAKSKPYCSRECYGKSCQKPFPCVVCGNPILAGLNKKTCSRSCSNKNRTGIHYRQGAPRDQAKEVKALKRQLISLRGNKCEKCGFDKVPEILELHHIVRRCDGGSNDLTNLKILCPNCHRTTHLNNGRDPVG